MDDENLKKLPYDEDLAVVSSPGSQKAPKLDGRLVWVVTFELDTPSEVPILGPQDMASAPREPCLIRHVTMLIDATTGDQGVSFGTQ